MKKVLLIVTFLCIQSGSAFSQVKFPPDELIQDLKTKLSLSERQSKLVESIILENQNKLNQLLEKKKKEQNEFERSIFEIISTSDDKIAQLLDKEQFEKFRHLIADRMKEFDDELLSDDNFEYEDNDVTGMINEDMSLLDECFNCERVENETKMFFPKRCVEEEFMEIEPGLHSSGTDFDDKREADKKYFPGDDHSEINLPYVNLLLDLKLKLNLTNQQAKEVERIFEKNEEKIRSINNNESDGRDNFFDQIQEILKSSDQEVEKVLNDEQKIVFKKMKENRNKIKRLLQQKANIE
jgi:hypothetical protein